MLKKVLRASPWLAVATLIVAVYFYASFEHIQADACTKGSNPEHDECATYNIVIAYALRGVHFLDGYNGAVTAMATMAIAWFTLSLKQATREHSEIHKRLTGLTERAMTRSDEPYVLVEKHEILQPTRPRSAAWPPTAYYTLIFGGRTPATLRAVYDKLLFCDVLPKPIAIDFDSAFPNTVHADGSMREDNASMTLEVARKAEDEIFGKVDTTKSYFLVGRVVYDDVFGNQHEFGYCYNASSQGGEGVPHGSADYNYRRIRKPEERI